MDELNRVIAEQHEKPYINEVSTRAKELSRHSNFERYTLLGNYATEGGIVHALKILDTYLKDEAEKAFISFMNPQISIDMREASEPFKQLAELVRYDGLYADMEKYPQFVRILTDYAENRDLALMIGKECDEIKRLQQLHIDERKRDEFHNNMFREKRT
ncbi:MAG: hypothetical protein V1870_03775 [Candidatus Aenigmatarchaeota archaeon]